MEMEVRLRPTSIERKVVFIEIVVYYDLYGCFVATKVLNSRLNNFVLDYTGWYKGDQMY
jgi:hypothetical protein